MVRNEIAYDLDYKKRWVVNDIGSDVIKCNKCKSYYNPTIKDVSTKNPNYYYKTCKVCRDWNTEYIKARPHLHHSNYTRFNTYN